MATITRSVHSISFFLCLPRLFHPLVLATVLGDRCAYALCTDVDLISPRETSRHRASSSVLRASRGKCFRHERVAPRAVLVQRIKRDVDDRRWIALISERNFYRLRSCAFLGNFDRSWLLSIFPRVFEHDSVCFIVLFADCAISKSPGIVSRWRWTHSFLRLPLFSAPPVPKILNTVSHARHVARPAKFEIVLKLVLYRTTLPPAWPYATEPPPEALYYSAILKSSFIISRVVAMTRIIPSRLLRILKRISFALTIRRVIVRSLTRNTINALTF